MEIKLYGDTFPIARAFLKAGEEMIAESDAMVAYQGPVEIEAKTGGFFSALARSFLGGESFFRTHFKALGDAWIDFTSPTLGEMKIIEASEGWIVESGSFIASAATVEMSSTKFAGISAWIGGEGMFMLEFSGSGPVIISTFGQLFEKELAAGEKMVIDTGHFVARTRGVDLKLSKAAGLFSSIFSGEGLVFEVTGPGKIIYQSRSTPSYISWLDKLLPRRD